MLAGPFYVVAALAQALTREGFDLTRHSWSLLSNGELGWIQIANFLLSGLFVIVAAVGFRRALTPIAGSRWTPSSPRPEQLGRDHDQPEDFTACHPALSIEPPVA